MNDKINVAFLCGLFPKEIQNEIILNSRSPIQFAADALQWSFVEGLKDQVSLKIINLPYVGAYPHFYKKIHLPNIVFGLEDNLNAVSLGYNNLVAFKNFSKLCMATRLLNDWASKTTGKKVILVYGIHSPFLLAAKLVKIKHPDVKICNVITDLPEYMGGAGNLFRKLLKRLNKHLLNYCLKDVDAYVFLSEFMTEKINIENKLWILIEGMYNTKDSLFFPIAKDTSGKKSVLYTGTLDKRYGIVNLLDAFVSIKDDQLQLVICGEGDSKEEVLNRKEMDDRIIYKGQLIRSQILELQMQSFLLVNPRTAEGDFTKYSFPSKTMEYLASGTPTLLYKLPAIPEEYYTHCFTLDGNEIGDLKRKIEDICALPNFELTKKGVEAREFILTNKNPKQQCDKLVSMLVALYN